ncbi:MAG: orotidine-5'-phosphate decarboxylase [Acidobacteriota bacterium]|nr:orotidine-5'-phosphate decarboxylase [Acidobacteriota bacterium]
MASHARERLIVALDYPSLPQALAMARQLEDLVGYFKIGSQLFTAEGPRALEKLARFGGIFLDLKFHDIPNTVAGAVTAAASLPGVRFLNMHALAGLEAMKAAAEAVEGRKSAPRLLGVTILTSHDERSMKRIGLSGKPEANALRLAKLARAAGLDGVVASAREVGRIRRACGPEFVLMVPGIRPVAANVQDQVRVATPGDAIRAGADYLVVGRPITGAPAPTAAAAAIVAEIGQAMGKE